MDIGLVRASRRGRFARRCECPGRCIWWWRRIGGRDDYSALFHEAGHAEHFTNVDPALPSSFGVWATTRSPRRMRSCSNIWSRKPSGCSGSSGSRIAQELVAHASAERLVYLRRYTGKLAYELELHGDGAGGWGALAGRYSGLLGAALGVGGH